MGYFSRSVLGYFSKSADTDGSSANGGAIAGAVLVILGALTALFGWWFKNGEQFKLPF